MTQLTESQLNKLMQYAAGGTDEPEGDGWLTKDEWLEEFKRMGNKMGENRFRCMIKGLMGEGKAESYEGTALNSSGNVCRRVWYRVFFDKMED